MVLVIHKRKSKNFDSFIQSDLKKVVTNLITKSIDKRKLKLIDKEFGIDSAKILRNSCSGIIISEDYNSYFLEFDKNTKIDGRSIANWIDLISYGNRSVQGYNLVYNILEYVAKHIDELYKVWRIKHGY